MDNRLLNFCDETLKARARVIASAKTKAEKDAQHLARQHRHVDSH